MIIWVVSEQWSHLSVLIHAGRLAGRHAHVIGMECQTAGDGPKEHRGLKHHRKPTLGVLEFAPGKLCSIIGVFILF